MCDQLVRRLSVVSRLFILMACVSICQPVFSQYTGYTSLSDPTAFKNKFKAESANVLSIQCNFKQEKILSALTEKIVSSGKFWFKRSNKVRIEYTKPFMYLLVMNGDKLLIRDEQKESRVNVKANRLFQQVNRIMIDCVQGTILDSKDFTSKIFENKDTFLLEMTPTSKALREYFQTIVLVVDKANYSANSIEMNEPSGDKTTIMFTDKKLNAQVSDEMFTL